MIKSFISRFNSKLYSVFLIFALSIFIVGCTETPEEIIDDPNEPDVISFQSMYNDAMTQLKSDESYNLVVEINRKRANETQITYRKDDYTFFNREDIFAFFEYGENFFKRIDDTVYSYYENDGQYIQSLAYPAMNDWAYESFLPNLLASEPTLEETDSGYEYSFAINAGTFINANPAYLAYLLTISNATLKDESNYDLSDINFNITTYFTKPSKTLFNISFDTVDYLNEVLDTNVNGYENYVLADVHFLYNTNTYSHDLSLIDTYTIDDYPNYAWAEVNRTYIELNTPKSIDFQYSVDADVLSFNVQSDGNYHIEFNHEYRHSLVVYDSVYNFIGFYYMDSGYYDIDLVVGSYYLLFNSAGAIGQYEVSITVNN
ncbi:MAG: hypothetical protein K9L02_04685 [Acholeplasmataceae bacterium]|nr:hypothetical protein [Acholeplasmataceae bacterium]